MSGSKNNVSVTAKMDVSPFTGMNSHACQMKQMANGAQQLEATFDLFTTYFLQGSLTSPVV